MPALLWQLSRVPWQHAPLSRCYNKYYQQCSRQRSPVKFRNAINSIEAFAECTSARITVRVDVSSARRESTQLYDALPVVQPLRAIPPKKRKKLEMERTRSILPRTEPPSIICLLPGTRQEKYSLIFLIKVQVALPKSLSPLSEVNRRPWGTCITATASLRCTKEPPAVKGSAHDLGVSQRSCRFDLLKLTRRKYQLL